MWGKKMFYFLFLCFFSFTSITFALTSPYEKEKQLGIDLYLEAESLVYTPPSWFKPTSLENASEDASYRIHEVLPYEQDRYEDMYLVIPQLGLVTPIVQIPKGTADYTNMKAGQQISINKYLKGGIIEYAGSHQPGQWGKRVDFGHSNYYKSDDGRYKSIFSNLMALDPGDQVWYYVKQDDGSYKLFKYRVYASYNTFPSNVQPMLRDKEGADALIFGCTHGLDGRWMIEATYMGEARGKPVAQYEEVEVDPYAELNPSWRRRVDAALQKISWISDAKKIQQITQWFETFKKIRKKIKNADYLLLLEYLEYRLANIFPEDSL